MKKYGKYLALFLLAAIGGWTTYAPTSPAEVRHGVGGLPPGSWAACHADGDLPAASRPRAMRTGTAAQAEARPLSAFEGVLPKLRNIFRDEGVPPGLVWIAEVESEWNAQAVSPKGAVGLFQFMPDTARRFGLRNCAYDERTHPYKSARAAACYLRQLYDRFGSWRLALAAYNTGEGRVQRVLYRSGATDRDEIILQLPSVTQDYVARVMDLMLAQERLRQSAGHLADS